MNGLTERVINRMVGTTLVVSIAGRRVRIVEDATGPIDGLSDDSFFKPGWLCKPDDPRNAQLIKAVRS